jgi:hypothetical protein
VWREDIEDTEQPQDGTGDAGGSGGSGKTQWCGKVQRVVDGEAHQFNGWQGLVDSLLTMLSHTEGR